MRFSASDIISSLPPFPDPAERYPLGSAEWAARVTIRTHSAIGQLRDYGAAKLVEVLRYAIPGKPWLAFPADHPLNHIDAYFEALCGMNWEGLLAVVRSVDTAAARELETLRAENQTKFRPQGRHLDDHHNNIMMKQGDYTSYQLRRLARERPDILGRYEGGEFRSVRAAASEAGFVIARATIPSEMTIPQLATQLRRRFKREDLAELIRLLQYEPGD